MAVTTGVGYDRLLLSNSCASSFINVDMQLSVSWIELLLCNIYFVFFSFLSADWVNQTTSRTHYCGSTTQASAVQMEWTIKSGYWRHFQPCCVRITIQPYVYLCSWFSF